MAIGPKVATTFPTPLITATTAQPGFPASNVGLITRPARVWRSTTAGGTHTERLTFDLGTTQAVAAVVIQDVTGPTQLRIEAGNDNSTWPTNLGLITIPTDQRTNVKKLWQDTAFSARYVRISAESLGATTFVEIGTILILVTVRTWTDPIGAPLTWIIQQAATKITYEGGGGEINQDGPPYLRGAPGNPEFLYQNATVRTDVFTLVNVGKGSPVVWYDNLGDTSQFVIGQRDTDDVSVARGLVTFDASIAIEEYV
jgi:hypothetical protein